jgi:radical SAM protein with 4Fe4S-binding SPASM domain
MQTIAHSAPADALLAGTILEEYRDLLDSSSALEAARKSRKNAPVADTDDCNDCANSPSCQGQSRRPTRDRGIVSWNDLPLA